MENIDFKEILEQIGHGILLFETKFKKCIYCNPAACELLGYKEANLIGMPIDKLGIGEEKPKRKRILMEELKTKGELTFEHPYRHPIRNLRDVILTMKNIIIGKDPVIMLTWKDVTEEKFIQKRFFEHAQAIDATIDGIAMFDQNNNITYLNPSYARIHGYETDELMGKNWKLICSPEDLGRVQEEVTSKLLKDGHFRGRAFGKRKDGSIFNQMLTLTKLGNGKTIASVHDITNQIEAEERFMKIFSVSPIMMSLTTITDGRIAETNELALKMLGLSSKQVIGHTLEELGIYADPSARKRLVFQLLSGSIKNMEIDLKSSHGEIHHCLLSADIIHLSGEKLILSIISDITEKKEMDVKKKELEEKLARAEKMEAIGLLAGMIAHNLNNALMSIMGFSELLLFDKKKYDEKTIEILDKIVDRGKYSAKIIQDLMTFSQKEATKKELLDINPIISKCLHRNSLKLNNPFEIIDSIDIQIDLDKNIPKINGSEMHIEKTILNLVENAVESMKDGGSLIVKTFSQKTDKEVPLGNYVVMSISDNGKGIPPENLGKIFDPFFSTKELKDGFQNGLGLAVVWGIIRRHKGYVTVQSEVGKGSCFKLYFPIQ